VAEAVSAAEDHPAAGDFVSAGTLNTADCQAMAKKLLSEEDKKAITLAIQAAEGKTSGEIVFAIQDASAHYHHAALQGALAGVVAAVAIYLSIPSEHTIGLILWVELVSFAAFYALFSYLPWRRWFVSSHELNARVQQAAFMEFYASGLYRTREANGILIYLSLLERRVVVLGDRGIHEKMGDHHWEDVRDKIILGIREGRAREGICAAVECCGKALADHFPRRPDDINELSDQIIERKLRPEDA
jgi:putative membrane protein